MLFKITEKTTTTTQTVSVAAAFFGGGLEGGFSRQSKGVPHYYTMYEHE